MEFETAIGIEPEYVADVSECCILLNGMWYFTDTPAPDAWRNDVSFEAWPKVNVPGDPVLEGFRLEQNTEYYYKKDISIPKDYSGKRIYLRFDSVYCFARIYIDGQLIHEQRDCQTSFDVEITTVVTPGKKHVLTVGVTDLSDDPSCLSMGAGHPIAAILRDVKLLALPTQYLRSVHLNAGASQDGTANLQLHAELSEVFPAGLYLKLTDNKNKILFQKEIYFDNGETDISEPICQAALWDSEHPNLYNLSCELVTEGIIVQRSSIRIGFRRISFGGMDGTDPYRIYVNGKPVKLRGICLHDSFPASCRALDAQQLKKDIRMLSELNINYIRTSHYAPSREFLDYCDEAGIYVEAENGIAFQARDIERAEQKEYLNRFASMMELARNHPCVLIWSIANESVWNAGMDACYQWAKEKDGTRPVKFSYNETIPEHSIKTDIVSVHYVFYQELCQFASEIIADGKTPFLHDEIAHAPCYDIAEQIRDPNVHNYWGESFYSIWEQMHNSDGVLGAAIWAAKDNSFHLPAGNRCLFPVSSNARIPGNPWGAVWDAEGRVKPEAWHIKKIYSPVRLKTKETAIRDGMYTIPVENRFLHSKLDEIHCILYTKGAKREVPLPGIEPGESGLIMIPAAWLREKQSVILSFEKACGTMLDCYQINQNELPPVPYTVPQPITVLRENQVLHVKGPKYDLVFDCRSGIIIQGFAEDHPIWTGGPSLHMSGTILDKWQMDYLNVQEAQGNAIITVKGHNGSLNVVYEYNCLTNGEIRLKWSVIGIEPETRFAELGIAFDIPMHVSAVSWTRNALWDYYPESHIGRITGTALRKPKDSALWKDQVSCPVIECGNEINTNDASLDFRATKEYFKSAEIRYDGIDGTLFFVSDGNQALKMEYSRQRQTYEQASSGLVQYSGRWNREVPYGSNKISCYTMDDKAVASIHFHGTGIHLYGERYCGMGRMKILIDEKEIATINQDAASGNECPESTLFSIHGLIPGDHQMVLCPADDNKGKKISFIAFRAIEDRPLAPKARVLILDRWSYPDLKWGHQERDSAIHSNVYCGNIRVFLTNHTSHFRTAEEECHTFP